MRYVVFDTETSNMFSDVGKHDAALLDLSILALYDSKDNVYKSFNQSELSKAWSVLEHADVIVGWNTTNFDIPLLDKYYPGDLKSIPSLDLMEEVRRSFGRRLKLEAVASATLGVGKTANGLLAIQWWKEGAYDKVRAYCLEDVKITKQLYEYAVANGHVCFIESNIKHTIPLNLSNIPIHPKTFTHTLPF